MGAWIWMKCCVSTDVRTWTNWLTFEPDLDYSPDAGTGLLSPISYALQHGILWRRENFTYRYWEPIAAVMHGFKMVLFTARTTLSEVRALQRVPFYLWVWLTSQTINEQLCRRYVLSNECPFTCEFDWQVRQLMLTGTNQYLDLEGLVMLPLFLTYLTDRNCSVLFFCDSFVCTHTHTYEQYLQAN